MDKKTAYLISCSDHYGHRLHVIDGYLRDRGYDTRYLTSDFDHTSKQVFACDVPNAVQLHARPYRKNLSVDRILSHRCFARDVFRYLDQLDKQPDLVIALLPPNFLAYYGAKYKKRHPNVKLVFDIFDLWPETFPNSKAKKLLAPAFSVWAALRDRNLSAADFVTTECQMFRQKLKLSEDRSAAVYLCAEPLDIPVSEPKLAEDRLDLCYLGAINNIIDIPRICALLKQLASYKPVTLHIIGKGEREAEFVDGAKTAGAEVVFYGPVYDDEKKQQIMSRCHFGLNIMKSTVCVGLTMKSVDYFRHGLPIINSIPADTRELVMKHGTGIQLDTGCEEKITACSVADCLEMRENVRRVFAQQFAQNVILAQYRRIYDNLI